MYAQHTHTDTHTSLLTPVLGNVTWLFGNLHVTQMGQNYGKLENSHKNKRFKAGIFSTPLRLLLRPPHAKQTPSEHLGKTFEIQTALKYFSPLFFSICLTKATTTKRTFYRCDMTRQAHERTNRKRKQSKTDAEDRQTDKQAGQTGGQSAQQTVRQVP